MTNNRVEACGVSVEGVGCGSEEARVGSITGREKIWLMEQMEVEQLAGIQGNERYHLARRLFERYTYNEFHVASVIAGSYWTDVLIALGFLLSIGGGSELGCPAGYIVSNATFGGL